MQEQLLEVHFRKRTECLSDINPLCDFHTQGSYGVLGKDFVEEFGGLERMCGFLGRYNTKAIFTFMRRTPGNPGGTQNISDMRGEAPE